MSQAPVMPVFTDALIGDTTDLSIEEFGAYCMLLFVTWRNNGNALPDDDRRLARICRVTTRHWKTKLRPSLERFFDLSDGFWHQKGLEKQWQFVAQRAAVSRDNGARGGRSKALKDNETGNPSGLSQVPQEANHHNHNYKDTPLTPAGAGGFLEKEMGRKNRLRRASLIGKLGVGVGRRASVGSGP
jgi:uncharacterized protein YdaU (DUF1376 family)